MALHVVARRALATGAAASLLAFAGAGAAHADTTPPPPPTSFPATFVGGGSGASADAASAAATASAMAQQAAFEKASGAMCTDGSTKVNTFMAGGQYGAIAAVMATCTVAAPSGS